ncbi:MAG: DUF1697 domain-containing protein [Acidimicrobiaceae bacterium]|nr:DUF1697 domain-containing protein [Acidimicrobiaceae bacterium]
MRTHVALLRGINVGGRNKVAMTDLRAIVGSVGHTDIATYIQSGNVAFSAEDRDVRALADQLEQVIAAELGVTCAVVVVDREQLAGVIAANPFPQEQDHKRLHAIFRRDELAPNELAFIDRARSLAAEKGSDDEVSVVGSTLYLRTPGGIGRSDLAAQLSRSGGPGGTARNWATVLRLMELLDG